MLSKTLNIAEQQQVTYCVPLWVRDEQMKMAAKRPIGSAQPATKLRTEPIAIVCFGPSLNDTWEKVKDFEFKMTCSGSHKFMVSRGVIPTWHVEVDPRPHKVQLIGPPHPDVEYLICSACHKAVFDHLAGFNVRRWHSYNPDENEALNTWPAGEWALTGGSNVGLRCLTMARFFGFSDLHIFGMDGCEGASGKHAAEHPNQPKGFHEVEYGGRTWRTTPSMLECAKQTGREIDMLGGVKTTFYGEGLTQALMRDYVPQKLSGAGLVAFVKEATISEEYRQLNVKLHEDQITYGAGGQRHAETVKKIVAGIKTADNSFPSVLDYGCGKGMLGKALPFPIWEYDPAIPTKAEQPRPADLVVCTDVLEHIEPELLRCVLADLKRCVKQVGFFTISTRPAVKTLADGRNAHLIQEGPDWWKDKLKEYFHVAKMTARGSELFVVVGPKLKGKSPPKSAAVSGIAAPA